MADVALLAGGVQAAPLDYVIPGAQEIALKASAASFDGTSAAGDFVPTLQLIAPNGSVLASCPVNATVAAGASADASWFPGGRVAKQQAAAASLSWAAISVPHNTLVTANAGFNYNWGPLSTNDPATFALVGSPQFLRIKRTGTYLLTLSYWLETQPFVPVANPWTTAVYGAITWAGGPPPLVGPQQANANGIELSAGVQVWQAECTSLLMVDPAHVNKSFRWFYDNTLPATDLLSVIADVVVTRIAD